MWLNPHGFLNKEKEKKMDKKSNNYLSISCVLTGTDRLNIKENQDSFETAINKNLNIKAIIIADGLGSFQYSGLASKVVVKSVKSQIENLKLKEKIDLKNIFKNSKLDLISFTEKYKKRKKITFDQENSFATSLIVLIENEEYVNIGYVGNGAIWHIRGNFNHFNKSKYLPWNSMNYLNPHSIQNEFGKEALYKLISISNNFEESIPTIITINKDNIFFGDIFMICTDGIYSFDQVPIGKMKDNSIWIHGEKTMSLFYNQLNTFFTENSDKTDKKLKIIIKTYLQNLIKNKLIDDDSTIGLTISNKALQYQKKFKECQL